MRHALENSFTEFTNLGVRCVDFRMNAVTIPPRASRRLGSAMLFDNLVGWF